MTLFNLSYIFKYPSPNQSYSQVLKVKTFIQELGDIIQPITFTELFSFAPSSDPILLLFSHSPLVAFLPTI